MAKKIQLVNRGAARAATLERINAFFSHFKAIVDSSDDAIGSEDLYGNVQTWNKAAEKIFGYTAEEMIGKPVSVIYPPDHVDEHPTMLARILAGEKIEHQETVRRRKDGKLIDIAITVSPIKDTQGEIIGISKIASDITEKKQWEKRMREAYDELERANRAKDNFLAMLSHELRTPLNPVLLVASEAANDSSLPPAVHADFEMILRNVETEARLIDDLLDLSRVRTGKLNLEKKKVNLYEILLNSLALVRDQAREKGVAVVRDLHTPRAIVMGDAVRLQQVFSNVLKNAIKFTPKKGNVLVRSGVMDAEYVVQIADTGIGMTQGELAIAFEAFKQGEHYGTQQRFGGLGLGLAISSEFLKCHNGTITASSQGRGHGSTFTIKIPLFKSGKGNTEHFKANDFERGAHYFRNSKMAA
jgi:PAS domain S-box-containing protein